MKMEHKYRNHSFLNNITNDDIKDLPVNQFSGKIYLIDEFSKLKLLDQKLSDNGLWGFDTETRPSFKKGKKHKVSLLQLANSDEAYLIRLNKIRFPDLLVSFFENKQIIKIGLAIRDDLNSLIHLRNFKPEGFIELQQYVKNFDILDNGLKKLAANILGFRISKKQQTSNWEKDTLDHDQLIYAATDAWVCYKIYDTLQKHKG
jgi:ribonuclease D